MAQVIAKNLYKTYPNGVKAVCDFSLEIADREFIVLVGPSGCGKSTMLRMIAGLEGITDGELMIGGRRVNGVAPKDRDVAMVFQNYALYPHMTGYENMALGLTMRRIDKTVIREKVTQVAELLDIGDLLDRKPGQMSGGQQQRVALGRAIVRQPSVFLLDEPLSNLDAKLRNQMRLEIIKLHRQLQTTFVYVTHDQTEAMTMADRIVVMDQGYIQQIGTPEELYRRPCNAFVAGFIGVPNINFIPCTVEREDGHAYACFAGHRVALPDTTPALTGAAVLGVRPEDVRLCGQPSELEAVVELTEMAGSDNYLHLTVGGIKLVAKCSSRLHFGEGERIAIQFAEEGLLLFPPNHESV